MNAKKKLLVLHLVVFLLGLSFTAFSESKADNFKSFLKSLKLTEKGIRYLRKGRTRKAEESFLKAVKFYTKNYKAFAFLGELYFKKKDYKKACTFFEKSQKAFPFYKSELIYFFEVKIKKLEKERKGMESSLEGYNNEGVRINEYMCGSEAVVAKRNEERERVLRERVRLEKISERISFFKKELDKARKLSYQYIFGYHYAICLFNLKDYANTVKNCNSLLNKGYWTEDICLLIVKAYVLNGECEDAVEFEKKAVRKGIDTGKINEFLKENCF